MDTETENATVVLDRKATRARYAARTPLRGVSGQALQRARNDRRDARVVDRARSTRTRLVTKTLQAVGGKTMPLLPHRVGVQFQPCRDGRRTAALARRQHDPGPFRQTLRRAAVASQGCQLRPLCLCQDQRL